MAVAPLVYELLANRAQTGRSSPLAGYRAEVVAYLPEAAPLLILPHPHAVRECVAIQIQHIGSRYPQAVSSANVLSLLSRERARKFEPGPRRMKTKGIGLSGGREIMRGVVEYCCGR